MSKLMLEKETYEILGACFEVYKEKGCGFLEAVYQECLEIEFELRGLPARALVSLPLTYKERLLKKEIRGGFYLLRHRVGGAEGGFKNHRRASRAGSKLSQCDRAQSRVAGEFRALPLGRA